MLLLNILIEKPCQMKEGKIVVGHIIIIIIIIFLVNETCHPIWHPMVVEKLHVIYNMYIKCTQSS